ncbi:MAG: hypothetical protein QF704_07480 [Anaerolineales bacterium]|jgi:hypothetical protein|nr:hypothetical protein [Anaerolineales bacterium]
MALVKHVLEHPDLSALNVPKTTSNPHNLKPLAIMIVPTNRPLITTYRDVRDVFPIVIIVQQQISVPRVLRATIYIQMEHVSDVIVHA